MSKQAMEIKKRTGLAATTVNPEPEQIEALAYQLWLERGCPNGSDQQDWFQAEDQLRQHGAIHQAA